MEYQEFLNKKTHVGGDYGFNYIFMPDYLFDFQKCLVEWAIKKGRSAIFADTGMGKTIMELVWAQNIVQKTNKHILIAAPLAVSHQIQREGKKFGIECKVSRDGNPASKITITNYEKLHLFNSDDYIGFIADESSILKNYDGVRRLIITEFMKKLPYRMLCTATAAPNDHIELGTSAEALGEMGYMDMLGRFFKNDQNNCSKRKAYSRQGGNGAIKWRFKKHAIIPFWQWIASWARAIRKPSDLGFDDSNFQLPPLIENQHLIKNTKPLPGELFIRPAIGLKEQRQELSMTLKQRCEKAAELVNKNTIAVIWCHYNQEGDLLEKLIPEAVQISGKDSDDKKERILQEFTDNKIRILITKPKISGFGLNWQHCSHTVMFPSHSFEQYYQSIRRFWRYGQKNPVNVDIVTTGGGQQILENLQRKSRQADDMFISLVKYMNDSININNKKDFLIKTEMPTWL